jgi:flavin reductase (DIM6/NTAB) family NADH-FMN oxidoreductase RutF
MKDCDPFSISEDLINRIKKGSFLTVKAGDLMNTMTIGWALLGYIWQRNIFMVAVRNSRHTFSIIEKALDFTVTVPSADMKDALMFCGSNSGREVDKFTACNLVPAASLQTVSPVLQMPGIHLECRICFKAPMNPECLDPSLDDLYPAKDYHTLYFGEIAACYETDVF